jgi:hypothetical protein
VWRRLSLLRRVSTPLPCRLLFRHPRGSTAQEVCRNGCRPRLWPVNGLLSMQEPEIRRPHAEERQETAAASPSAAARDWPLASRCAHPCPGGPGRVTRELSSKNTGGRNRQAEAGHMIAIDPPVRILIFPLASEGPSTHAPRRPHVALTRFPYGRSSRRWVSPMASVVSLRHRRFAPYPPHYIVDANPIAMARLTTFAWSLSNALRCWCCRYRASADHTRAHKAGRALRSEEPRGGILALSPRASATRT